MIEDGEYLVLEMKGGLTWRVLVAFRDQIETAIRQHEEEGVNRSLILYTVHGVRLCVRSSRVKIMYHSTPETRARVAQEGES